MSIFDPHIIYRYMLNLRDELTCPLRRSHFLNLNVVSASVYHMAGERMNEFHGYAETSKKN